VVRLVRSLIARGSNDFARPIAFCTVSALAMAAGLGLPWPGSQAQAACAPATSGGTPSNSTVTCSGATLNQDVASGYGTGLQNTNTVNVQTSATVTGTTNGFFLGNGNTINLATGTLVTGGANGLVIGTGTTTLNNNNGGTVSGNGNASVDNGISMSSGTLIVSNTGTISGTTTLATGAGIGINSSGDVTVTSNTGSITGSTVANGNEAVGIQGNNVTIQSNTGTIAATGVNTANGALGIFGLSSVTIGANTGTISGTNDGIASLGTTNVTNNMGGMIQGTGATGSVGIISSGPLTLVNSGTVSGSVNGVNTNTAGATIITNNAGGVISSTSGGATPGAIRTNTATITNLGTITGDLGINFRSGNGPSTIFNGGTITGSGGTAIHFSTGSVGNTLTLAPGFAINGNVVGAGSDIFQLGGTGTGTFNLSNIGAAQQYQGFTTFNKIDASSWTVTGTGNQAWTVQSGNFLVNGTINGAVNVTGGLLGGSGAVGATSIGNGATLSPGSNGVGTLTVNGNLAFQSASLYLIGVTANASGRTTVTGSAAVAGTAQAVFQGSSFQGQYTILSAAGGRTGTFGNFIVTNLPAFFSASLVYTPTEVDLRLTSGLSQMSGLTGNQAAVAAALDRAANSGGGFLAGLAGLAPGQVPAALNALSGEGLSGTQETALGAGGTFLGTMMEQAENWLNGDTGGSAGAGHGAMNYAAEKPIAPVFKAMPKAMPLKAPAFQPRWRAWAAGFDGAWSLNGEADPGSADLTHRTAGGAAGVDYQVAPDVLVGAAGGGSASSFSVPDRATSGTLDGAHAGAYAVARRGGWYTAGSVAFAAFNNKTNRVIAGVGATESATASFNSNLLSGRLEMGFKQSIGGFAVTPFAAVQFAQLWQDGFSESSTTAAGAPGVLGLTVPSRTVSSLPIFAGVQLDSRVALPNGMFWTPYARAAWVHEFDPSREVTASLVTLPAAFFTVDGPRAARDAARIDAGSKLAISRSVSLFESFDGEFSARSRMYAGKAGIQVSW
jgi:outer membrane autotransporter protein